MWSESTRTWRRLPRSSVGELVCGEIDRPVSHRGRLLTVQWKGRESHPLLQAEMTSQEWPLACRYVHELERRRWMGREQRGTTRSGAYP